MNNCYFGLLSGHLTLIFALPLSLYWHDGHSELLEKQILPCHSPAWVHCWYLDRILLFFHYSPKASIGPRRSNMVRFPSHLYSFISKPSLHSWLVSLAFFTFIVLHCHGLGCLPKVSKLSFLSPFALLTPCTGQMPFPQRTLPSPQTKQIPLLYVS